MKGNELMIGDWVYFHNGTVVEPRRVTGVLIPDCIYLDLGYKPHTNLYTISSVEPIPLTAEILEKNGFGLYKQDFTSRRVYKFGCFDYIVINDDNEDSRYNYFSIGCYIEYKHFGTLGKYIHDVMKIRYVHELQHALRLCRINHEIIL